MDALIALRIKVSGKTPARSAGMRNMVGPGEPGVEMTDKSPQKENHPNYASNEILVRIIEEDKSDGNQGGRSTDQIIATNCCREEESFNKCKEDCFEILDHVKINNTLERYFQGL